MPTYKLARGASESAGMESNDPIYVLDPELEVRDGGLGKGMDKDIDVELKDPSGTCQADVEAVSGVDRKHKVKWKIKNSCGSGRKVKVVFGYPEGSPLEPCTLEVIVKKGETDDIKCKIRENADLRKYRYDLVVASA